VSPNAAVSAVIQGADLAVLQGWAQRGDRHRLGGLQINHPGLPMIPMGLESQARKAVAPDAG
jgi:hypothetical protein